MPKLTKRLIDSTGIPSNGQIFLRDTELSGFALRITKGSKTFILEKRVHGRVRRMTIGPYGALTVDRARAMAKELIGRIAAGEDPAEEIIGRRQEITFGEMANLYIGRHAPRKRSGGKDILYLSKYFSGWKSRRLSDISRKDVSLFHIQIGKRAPYLANRLLALLRKMFNLGRIWGVYKGENPATGIEFFKEIKRDRFIQPEELPGLMESLHKEENPYIQGALLISLFTGARIGEVLTMQWGDLDLDQGTWKIPHTKAGRPHYLPLPEPVLIILKRLPKLSGNPYCFPGRNGAGRLININKAWDRIRKRAGIPDIRIHDLRRTCGSWLAGSGVSLTIIGKVLNHTQPGTTAIYARLNIEPVRAVLEANARLMVEFSGLSDLVK